MVEQAAAQVGQVSPSTVKRAVKRMRADPEAHQAALDGDRPKRTRAEAAGAEAASKSRRASKGPKRWPDVDQALKQTRAKIQSWGIGDHIAKLCEAVDHFTPRDREMLLWLGKDLEKHALQVESDLLAIRQALAKFDMEGVVEAIGREVRSLPQESQSDAPVTADGALKHSEVADPTKAPVAAPGEGQKG